MANNENFSVAKISGWQFEINDDFPAKFPPGSKENFINGRRSDFIKLPSSKFANVFKFNLLFKGKVHNLILKQFLNRSFLDIFKNLLISCRADRAFKADLMLKQYGFSVPNIVAVGKEAIAGIPIKNLIITEEITDSKSLHNLLETNNLQRQEIISQFGKMVGKMHAENIFHGDLRFGNILVKKENNEFRFYLLDNERTKKFEKLPHRLRLKNLVQIWISRTTAEESERKTFLDAYLSQQKVKFNRDKFAGQIIARVKKRLAGKDIKIV